MRWILACLVSLACFTAEAAGPVVIVTAQDHAVAIARRGVLVHSTCNQYEGIGMGATPEQARRNCCFYGKRPIVEEGVAYSPARRMWFAVIRYR